MARTSRVARRSTGPFPELLQLEKKAQNRAASRSRFTQLRVRQQSISVASSTVSRSTTPDFESDNEAEEATASPPPRKRARVAQKRVLKEKACPASASTPRTRSSTEVADGSDVLRQRLKETEEKLTQVQELLQETQKTLQDKESELTVAKDMLASLGQENAKLRYVPASHIPFLPSFSDMPCTSATLLRFTSGELVQRERIGRERGVSKHASSGSSRSTPMTAM